MLLQLHIHYLYIEKNNRNIQPLIDCIQLFRYRESAALCTLVTTVFIERNLHIRLM